MGGVQLGYESVCMFGDCFDEVTLLDPVLYPGAIKVFAREERSSQLWAAAFLLSGFAPCLGP
eukprot:scaffold24208_cov51-Prasinocladus_malaysianus.AAC.2